MTVKPTGFTAELDVGCERKRKSRITTGCLGRTRVTLIKMENFAGKTVWRED